MKQIVRFLLGYAAAFTIITIFMFIQIHVDLFFNGNWLLPASKHWRWYNYLTTQHAPTVFYVRSSVLWLLPSFVSGFTGGIYEIVSSD